MSGTPITKPVYVTKWALTAGVMKFTFGHVTDGTTPYFSAKWGSCCGVFIGPKDWTYDIHTAEERYTQVINRKLNNIEKQRKKLSQRLGKPMPVKEMP